MLLSTPPVAVILIRSLPCFTRSRTALRISYGPSAMPSSGPTSGRSTGEIPFVASACPPVTAIDLPAATIRGPTTSPLAIRSRSA